MTPHARLTAALAEHYPNARELRCSCGWQLPAHLSTFGNNFTAHLASVITSLEGVAVVEIRALNRHIASGIQSYAGGESDGYSYHGDGSALEAMRHLSNQAAGLARYITTNLARAAEGDR